MLYIDVHTLVRWQYFQNSWGFACGVKTYTPKYVYNEYINYFWENEAKITFSNVFVCACPFIHSFKVNKILHKTVWDDSSRYCNIYFSLIGDWGINRKFWKCFIMMRRRTFYILFYRILSYVFIQLSYCIKWTSYWNEFWLLYYRCNAFDKYFFTVNKNENIFIRAYQWSRCGTDPNSTIALQILEENFMKINLIWPIASIYYTRET